MKQHTVMTACILLGLLALVSEAHPQGRHRDGERRINTFLGRIQRSGICEEYNAATEDEQTTCSDGFVNDFLPNMGRRRSLAVIVDFICLKGGVTATSACAILDIVCATDSTGTSTLETCPRPQGNRKRRDDDSGEDDASSGEDDEEEEEEAEEVDGDAAEGGTGTGADAGVTDSGVTDVPGAATTPAGTGADAGVTDSGVTDVPGAATTPAGTTAGTPVPNP